MADRKTNFVFKIKIMEEHIYKVDLQWRSERKGEISSPDLEQLIEVATPPEFPKGIEGLWSPEHLYTAAVSSCFMTTFLAIAENSNLGFHSFSCPAKGKLSKLEGRFIMSEILLEPVLIIKHPKDIDKAGRILEKAEKACLITSSIKAQVYLHPEVRVAESLVYPNI